MKPWEEYQKKPDAKPWEQYQASAAPTEQPPVAAQLAQPQKRQWSDVPLEALLNTPSSAANFATGLYQAVRHPIDTGSSILDAAAGGLRNAMPESVRALGDRMDWNPQATQRATQTADAIGGFYKDRYGSEEGFKNALATDPVGIASDLSAVLTGGAALAPKASTLANVLNKGARLTNPVTAVTKAAQGTGKLTANTIGAFGTHTGGMPIQEAFGAGTEGGKRAQQFRQNMRGQVPMTDVLDDVKANIATMGRAKSAEYRSGMAQVSGDTSILKFDGIDKAVSDANSMSRFKGQVKNARAADVVGKIGDEIKKWKQLDPAEFHTPEGLDALKQRVGGIVEGIPFEEKTARAAASQIYNSIKGEIAKQAPTYAKTMKDYAEATDEIREIERALSAGNRASVDTAMRKLQSLTRNNVNTNFGNRLDLAKTLEQKGGRELMPSLAGQALNTWVPRGIGGTVAGGVGLGGYAVGGLPLAAGTLAMQSPRLVGETAYAAGRATSPVMRAAKAMADRGIDPEMAINLGAQYGLLGQRRQAR